MIFPNGAKLQSTNKTDDSGSGNPFSSRASRIPGSDHSAIISSRQASSIDLVCRSSLEIVVLNDAFLASPLHTDPPRIEIWLIVSDLESSSTTDIGRRIWARSTERHLLRLISTCRRGANRIRSCCMIGNSDEDPCDGATVGDDAGVPSSSTMKLTARIRFRWITALHAPVSAWKAFGAYNNWKFLSQVDLPDCDGPKGVHKDNVHVKPVDLWRTKKQYFSNRPLFVSCLAFPLKNFVYLVAWVAMRTRRRNNWGMSRAHLIFFARARCSSVSPVGKWGQSLNFCTMARIRCWWGMEERRRQW